MKPSHSVALALTLLQAPATPRPAFHSAGFRFIRPILTKAPGESCAVLDALVLSHAAPSLKDLRLSTPIGEVSYNITLSETTQITREAASVVRMSTEPASIAFDLAMPAGPYTEVDLDLRQQDFVVKATVSGTNSLSAQTRVPLGTFTLFDLTSRHLSRNTMLPLQESTFPYLHIELHGNNLLPTSIRGAQVPPSREAQTIYTPVDISRSTRHQGSNTIASFEVPAHVPVERVSVNLSPGYNGNFSRKVSITGRSASGEPLEVVEGAISRVHLGKIQYQQMTFPAVMGVNLQENATIEVTIEDGGEPPLPIASIALEMRRRSICFDAPATPVTLFYGDPSLSAPALAPVSSRLHALVATLGPEIRNPAFQQQEDTRTLAGRRPDLVWFLLLAGLGVGGVLLLHTLRRH